MKKVSNRSFYKEYHGHTIADLETLFNSLNIVKHLPNQQHSFVWLVGDSSLDNKYWIPNSDSENACNGYEEILSQPNAAIPDIAHCLNRVFAQRLQQQQQQQQNARNQGNADHNDDDDDQSLPSRRDRANDEDFATKQAASQADHYYTCINCSVEESTVGEREDGKLFRQDEFVRDHMSPNDILVVSLGGNDIALKPSKSTIASMGWLSKCARTANVVDGTAWGLGHFHTLLHDQYQAYLLNVTSKCKPKLIVPCMIYHLDENPKSESWANRTLELIGYNANPKHVQAIIHRLYLDCMVNDPFKVAGSAIHPIEMSRALDGSDSGDYDNRVEPSAQGGRKIADLISKEIFAQIAKMDRGENSMLGNNDDDDDQGSLKCVAISKKRNKKSVE